MKEPKLADVCGQRIDIAQVTAMTFADDNFGDRNSSHTNPSCAENGPPPYCIDFTERAGIFASSQRPHHVTQN
jgi:hypothetical protein